MELKKDFKRLVSEDFSLTKSIVVALIGIGCFAVGVHSERDKHKDKSGVVCTTHDVLQETKWYVDLKRSLFDQECSTHPSFPNKILCERTVTLECDVPKGAAVPM